MVQRSLSTRNTTLYVQHAERGITSLQQCWNRHWPVLRLCTNQSQAWKKLIRRIALYNTAVCCKYSLLDQGLLVHVGSLSSPIAGRHVPVYELVCKASNIYPDTRHNPANFVERFELFLWELQLEECWCLGNSGASDTFVAGKRDS